MMLWVTNMKKIPNGATEMLDGAVICILSWAKMWIPQGCEMRFWKARCNLGSRKLPVESPIQSVIVLQTVRGKKIRLLDLGVY